VCWGASIMTNNEMEILRNQMDDLNLQILDLINERAKVVQQIGEVKEKQSMKRFDPVRERDMLNQITTHNDGPFENSTIEHIFKEIFKASLELQEDDHRKALLVSRKKKSEDTIINVKGEQIGDGNPHYVMGPCAVESYEQVAQVAAAVKNKVLNFCGVELLNHALLHTISRGLVKKDCKF